MTRQILRFGFIMLLGFAGCQPNHAAPSNDVTSDCPEVLKQSRAAGIDYVPTLRKAAAGDDAALASLLELTGSDHFDAAAQQCHIEALAEVLKRLGDRQFSIALAAEPSEVRRAVVNGLILEHDNLPTAQMSRSAFADNYPHTAATVSP